MKTESLPVQLTEEEMNDFGKRSAREVKNILEIKQRAKDFAADFKATIKEREDELKRLAECINSEREYREVEITEEIDRASGRVNIVRIDTGQFVRSRPLTVAEQQTSLDSLY